MVKLDELQAMWSSDCKIDQLNLGAEAVRTAELHSKYLNLLTNFRLHLRKYESQMAKLRRVKWRYFRGELTLQELQQLGWDQYLGPQPLKNEMQEFLDTDDEVNTLEDKVEYVRTCFIYCETVMKSLNSRTWDIKNTIEWEKFTNGTF